MPIRWIRRSIASCEVAVGAHHRACWSRSWCCRRGPSARSASTRRTLLELIAAAFTELLAGLTRGRDNDALHRIQDGIGAAMVGLNAIGAEAERERAARSVSGPDTGPLLRTILRLRHDVVMIGRATVVPLPADVQARLPRRWPKSATRSRIICAPPRRPCGAAAARRRFSRSTWRCSTMPTEVAAVRSDGLIRGLPGDIAERFFALGFSLEQMRQNLGDLDRCRRANGPKHRRRAGSRAKEQARLARRASVRLSHSATCRSRARRPAGEMAG